MPTRRTIPQNNGIYFITFTCANWYHLFEISNSYDLVYNWFKLLQKDGHHIVGYVIMPNHIHAIIAFKNTEKSINTIIGNGKRFMAYKLVKRLEKAEQHKLLVKMQNKVSNFETERNKKHQVFQPSFDWKECSTEFFINQKLDYIHENPCKGEPPLVQSPQDYQHSSAKAYINNEHVHIKITTYLELDDIDLTAV